MAKYAVSEDGVQALNAVASLIIEAKSQILALTNTLENTSSEKAVAIGPHKVSLLSALSQIKETEKQATEPVKEISEMLEDVADAYKDIIDNDRFAGICTKEGATGVLGVATSTSVGNFKYRAKPNNIKQEVQSNTIQSISAWIKDINPHYGNPFLPQSKVNCGSCALAVESRLNGNPTAIALLTNIGTDSGMEQATGKKCIYMSVYEIERHLKDMGAGSHLIIGINRMKEGKAISGHWFNAFYDGNRIYTIEGQSGQILEWPHDYGYISEWCALI